MPIGGADRQYDLTWEEQDKIRRRRELKLRLKEEGIRKRYDPFLQLKRIIFTDPASDRYLDLRKTGRMPNTPFRPGLFFSLAAWVFVPPVIIYYIAKPGYESYQQGCRTGEIPYKDRKIRTIASVA